MEAVFQVEPTLEEVVAKYRFLKRYLVIRECRRKGLFTIASKNNPPCLELSRTSIRAPN